MMMSGFIRYWWGLQKLSTMACCLYHLLLLPTTCLSSLHHRLAFIFFQREESMPLYFVRSRWWWWCVCPSMYVCVAGIESRIQVIIGQPSPVGHWKYKSIYLSSARRLLCLRWIEDVVPCTPSIKRMMSLNYRIYCTPQILVVIVSAVDSTTSYVRNLRGVYYLFFVYHILLLNVRGISSFH